MDLMTEWQQFCRRANSGAGTIQKLAALAVAIWAVLLLAASPAHAAGYLQAMSFCQGKALTPGARASDESDEREGR